MVIFYSDDCGAGICRLDAEESLHCVKVLRHRSGDCIHVIDGQGSLHVCRLCEASPKGCTAEIIETRHGWGSHPYVLHMGVCPTKNNERFEWFAEKATEIGVDVITPLIGEHSERRVFKGERLKKILLSACKQSLKARIPELAEPVTVKEFIAGTPEESLRLIACCFEDETHPRRSITEVLQSSPASDVTVLIGPEGDFSPDELHAALDRGFIPVHLGTSRLRTETAALAAVAAVYFRHIR